MGERGVRNAEVRGSIPLCSTRSSVIKSPVIAHRKFGRVFRGMARRLAPVAGAETVSDGTFGRFWALVSGPRKDFPNPRMIV